MTPVTIEIILGADRPVSVEEQMFIDRVAVELFCRHGGGEGDAARSAYKGALHLLQERREMLGSVHAHATKRAKAPSIRDFVMPGDANLGGL